MAFIRLGSTTTATYDGVRTYFDIYAEETNISLVNNTSDVKIRLNCVASRSNYGRSSNGGEINIGDNTYSLPSKTSGANGWKDGDTLTTNTYTFAHDPITGKASINVSVSINLGLGSARYTYSGSFTLSQIDRLATVAVDPKMMIVTTTPLSVTVTRSGNTSFVHSVDWRIKPSNSVWSSYTSLIDKGTQTSFNIPFATIASKLGTAYTGEVEVRSRTYNGDTLIGTYTASAQIKTGNVPLTLYDDTTGNVGVSLMGPPADQPGIFIDNKGPFALTKVNNISIGEAGSTRTVSGYILFYEG